MAPTTLLFLVIVYTLKRTWSPLSLVTCRGSGKAQVVLNETTEPHAYMYYTPIVRHGFRQGAFRACIYITRRAHRNFMPDYLFWNLADFDKSNIKRRLRLNLMYQGIWTGSLPHCLLLFPSRLAAWSSTNCLQRYIKNPEPPRNSGDFCDNIVFLEGIFTVYL